MTVADVRRAVRGLAGEVPAWVPEIEAARRLPDDLVTALRRTGINRLVVPPELGGLGAPVRAVMEVAEDLAAVDGSTAWCATIGAGGNLFAGHLPEAGARDVFADPDLSTATMLAPDGRLQPDEDGGLRLSGRWAFASNCLHSGWIGLGAMLDDPSADGPRPVVAFVPMAEVEVDDTWDAPGLRGTGSHHVVAVEVPVPIERCHVPPGPGPWAAAPVFHLPLHTALIPMLTAVVLGIARGAVDEVIRQAQAGSTAHRGRLGDDRIGLADLATADTTLRGARAGLVELVEAARATAEDGRKVSRTTQARVALACSHAVSTAVESTLTAHRLGGGAAAYGASPLRRAADDVLAARQHLLFAHQHRPDLLLIAAGEDRTYPPFVT
jgi:alkylation response protein AidB-like acyl-CoA dehydrogenase